MIDTSPYFGGGVAQHVLGEILTDSIARADIHIVSRAGLTPHGPDASRHSIESTVRGTLAELGTTWIDTLVLAQPDFDTPVEETADALSALVTRGVVHALGIGNCPGWYGATLAAELRYRGVSPTVIHAEYSLLNRGIEREIVPCAQHVGAGIMAWSPLGRGVLTGRYRHSTPTNSRAASAHLSSFVEPYLGENSRRIVESVATAAEGLGCDIATVSLAWVLAQPGLGCAVVGPRTDAQLTSLLQADFEDVPEAVLEALSEITEPQYGYPERF